MRDCGVHTRVSLCARETHGGEREIERETDRQAGRQTDRQTDEGTGEGGLGLGKKRLPYLSASKLRLILLCLHHETTGDKQRHIANPQRNVSCIARNKNACLPPAPPPPCSFVFRVEIHGGVICPTAFFFFCLGGGGYVFHLVKYRRMKRSVGCHIVALFRIKLTLH